MCASVPSRLRLSASCKREMRDDESDSMSSGRTSTPVTSSRITVGTSPTAVAIHGLLLTAWSMAGIFGPVLVNYIRAYNVSHGIAKAQAYNVTMYVMAVLLVIGFICNWFVTAVHRKHYMKLDPAEASARV